ncbi:RNA polymerase [Streptomyces rapamycinicus NRRL 5491]|nr:sigma factor-like helix-turn-helix DNA-binding protein [Streptomyces rapamycinicus]UTO68000.1 RNA polymerase [Streptomyces rapamycinicus]UTP37193.1 RNA polymerase [Streptomyces rapamycinicus NRRL 5491]
MRERRAARDGRRAREFEAFVAGAGGRLLHAATLLTGEPTGDTEAAERLLTAALARTYARWDRLRGEDPYDHTRRTLAALFAHRGHRYRRPRGGTLARLTPQERLVLVLRLYEGVAEEQTAAALGLPVERVRAICTRAVTAMRSAAARRGTTGTRPSAGTVPSGGTPSSAGPTGPTSPTGSRAATRATEAGADAGAGAEAGAGAAP